MKKKVNKKKTCRHRWHFIKIGTVFKKRFYGHDFYDDFAGFVCDKCGKTKNIKIKHQKRKVKKQEEVPEIIPEVDGGEIKLAEDIEDDEEIIDLNDEKENKYKGL